MESTQIARFVLVIFRIRLVDMPILHSDAHSFLAYLVNFGNIDFRQITEFFLN